MNRKHDIRSVQIHGAHNIAMAFSLILGERAKQIEKGFNEQHDALHEGCELVDAASSMLERSRAESIHDTAQIEHAKRIWPWALCEMPERISSMRDLIIATSLLVAEIERRLNVDE